MRISHHSLSSFFYGASKWIFIGIILIIGSTAFIGRFAAAGSDKLIPDEAIRIRIIANSDNKSDQSIKNNVRDEVAAYIASWGDMPSTYDEAHRLIQKRLPHIQKRVDAVLHQEGTSYGAVVELAKVPFPEKVFDGETYPAGDYEALRITLGQGSGKNWWCVLFPPLCLTAATAKSDQSGDVASSGASQSTNDSAEGEQPKPKFFLWELFQKLLAFLSSLFS